MSEDTTPTDSDRTELETGAHARGVDLFDEPLEGERGFVQIEAGGRTVDVEHRVQYDHDPPVEIDARYFGTMTEMSLDFEFGGRRGRALLQLPNEAMREFIQTMAPEVGLRVAEIDEDPASDPSLECANCGDRLGLDDAVYDADDEEHERPYCSSRCWARSGGQL